MKNAKILSHGTAYFLKGGELCGSPLLANGEIDHGTVFSVDRSSEGFRQGHIAALKLLGVREQDVAWYLNRIVYG